MIAVFIISMCLVLFGLFFVNYSASKVRKSRIYTEVIAEKKILQNEMMEQTCKNFHEIGPMSRFKMAEPNLKLDKSIRMPYPELKLTKTSSIPKSLYEFYGHTILENNNRSLKSIN